MLELAVECCRDQQWDDMTDGRKVAAATGPAKRSTKWRGVVAADSASLFAAREPCRTATPRACLARDGDGWTAALGIQLPAKMPSTGYMAMMLDGGEVVAWPVFRGPRHRVSRKSPSAFVKCIHALAPPPELPSS